MVSFVGTPMPKTGPVLRANRFGDRGPLRAADRPRPEG